MYVDEFKKNKKKKVLILSAPIGLGHVQAAKAIEEELLLCENTSVIFGDIFDFVPNFFSKSLLKIYLFLLDNLPKGYDFLYKWGDQTNSLHFRNFVNSLFAYGAYKYIDKIEPDIVITTHVTPAGIVALYKRKYNKNTPLFGIVTDFTMHKWWIYKEINAYVISDKHLFDQYLDKIEDNQEIWELGIPIRRGFFNKNLKKTVSIPKDKFVCLLTGGGEGLLPMKKILSGWSNKASNIDKNVFFIAVCGNNIKLKEKLDNMNMPNLLVLGYIDNIYEYMLAADLIITKAGGVTISEAIAIGLPVFLYKPLPGQESENVRYLESKGLIYSVLSIDDIYEKIKDFSSGKKDLLLKIKENQKKYFTFNSTSKIVKQIFKYMDWK